MTFSTSAITQASIQSDFQQMARIASHHPISSSAQPVAFSQVFQGALAQVDGAQHQADVRQTAVDMGKSDDLAGAMLASQQAALSFSALVQVRNKLATGLNDIMSMSI